MLARFGVDYGLADGWSGWVSNPFPNLNKPQVTTNAPCTDAFLATLNAGADFGGMDDEMDALGMVEENAMSLDTRDLQDAGACVCVYVFLPTTDAHQTRHHATQTCWPSWAGWGGPRSTRQRTRKSRIS